MAAATLEPRPAAHRPGRSFRRACAQALSICVGGVPVAVTLVFTAVPVVLAVLYTLGKVGGLNETVAALATHQVVARHGISFGAYEVFFADAGSRADLWVTLWVTLASSAVLVAMAWALALFVRFSRGRLGRAVSTLYVVPMFIPTVIASYALVTFWQQNGKLAGFLHVVGINNVPLPGFTTAGVVLGLVWTDIPFAVILISSGLQGVPDVLIEAARDAGASWWRIVRTVLVPLNKLPTLIVVIFTATDTLGAFTIPDLMGPNAPQMLGVAMTDSYQSYGQPQQAEVMAMLVFLGALLLSGLYLWASQSDRRRSARQQSDRRQADRRQADLQHTGAVGGPT
jgi:ABC-type spermidine/putrescine transport system permease subunit I